jgi:hypothetical protein
MTQPRAADDFATIRARMVELRRERERAEAAEGGLHGDQPTHRARRNSWPAEEISAGPGRVGHRSDKQLDWDEPWSAQSE